MMFYNILDLGLFLCGFRTCHNRAMTEGLSRLSPRFLWLSQVYDGKDTVAVVIGYTVPNRDVLMHVLRLPFDENQLRATVSNLHHEIEQQKMLDFSQHYGSRNPLE